MNTDTLESAGWDWLDALVDLAREHGPGWVGNRPHILVALGLGVDEHGRPARYAVRHGGVIGGALGSAAVMGQADVSWAFVRDEHGHPIGPRRVGPPVHESDEPVAFTDPPLPSAEPPLDLPPAPGQQRVAPPIVEICATRACPRNREQPHRDRVRPLCGGLAIRSNRVSSTGTLGLTFERGGRHFGVTASHVVMPMLTGTPPAVVVADEPEPVRQPSGFGGQEVGRVAAWIPLVSGRTSLGDVALVELSEPCEPNALRTDAYPWSLSEVRLGEPRDRGSIRIGEEVFGLGIRSQPFGGRVVAVAATVVCQDENMPAFRYAVQDSIIVLGQGRPEFFGGATQGDSGAVVWDGDRRPVGVVFSTAELGPGHGAGRLFYVTPWNVVERLIRAAGQP